MWLVAVDPGIDATGVACFDLGPPEDPAWRGALTFAQVMDRMGPASVVRTKPQDPLVTRLGRLGLEFGKLTELPGVIWRFVLEQPAAAGAYAARRRRQQTKGLINAAALGKLHLALGVLIDSALCHSEAHTDAEVELVPAPRVAKEARKHLVLGELRRRGHLLATEKRPSPDVLDAIYLGAAWASSPARRCFPDSPGRP